MSDGMSVRRWIGAEGVGAGVGGGGGVGRREWRGGGSERHGFYSSGW